MKKLITVLSLIPLLAALGCSTIVSGSAPASHEIVKKAVLNSKWQMYQLRVQVVPGSDFAVLLKLAEGDKVDGYFLVEKGNNAEFQIVGNSSIYKSEAKDATAPSDRFTFTATQAQGNTYILTIRNKADKSSKEPSTITFLEVIYPVSGVIFIPLEAK